MRALAPFIALLSAGCGQVHAQGAVELPPPAKAEPESALSQWVSDLGREEAPLRRRAAERLRAEGERALPLLEKAGTPRARRLAGLIVGDLVAKEREADDAVLASPPSELASLPTGSWALVAEGRLLGTGPTREAALAKDVTGKARHRYLWRAGEDAAARTVELGSLAPGDVGLPLRRAVGEGPGLMTPEGGTATLPGASPEDWRENAAALDEGDALRLSLARWEIPGKVTVRSRVGAGVIGVAWRARAMARSADGAKSCDVVVWVLPDREALMDEKTP